MKRILPLVALLGCASAPEVRQEELNQMVMYLGTYAGRNAYFVFADLQPPRSYDSVVICDEKSLLNLLAPTARSFSDLLLAPTTRSFSDLCYDIALFRREGDPEYATSTMESVIQDLSRRHGLDDR